jgi:glyoxylase-like metal-dependent hydrolase (beta-lactamase superfamily II)
MRKIKKNIYTESKYSGVHLAFVATSEGLLLVDCPLRVEDTKEWLSQVSEYGKPRYMALLDAHPDRVLGARAIEIPLIAQDRTLETIREWADTFKGSVHPIGAESDRLKRITSVQRAAPEVVFTDQMVIQLGHVRFEFLHRPGPQPGSSWILLPKEKVAFIGDTVVLDEPPYVGHAHLNRWIDLLDELRGSTMGSYTLVSSQGAPIRREHINAMARFLRKVEHRVAKLLGGKWDEEDLELIAEELLEDFTTPGHRRDQALQRLKVGLVDLSARDG